MGVYRLLRLRLKHETKLKKNNNNKKTKEENK